MKIKNVSIVVQARSTSTRFPRKIFEIIGTKQILQHVLDSCYNSASYINAMTNKHGIICGVALAIPDGDEVKQSYARHRIIEGSEHDVLARYKKALDELKSDYVVRITSDCPFIPPYIISKMIQIAVSEEMDFLTNADPRFRTAPDGHDCEVMSRRAIEYADKLATGVDREHVTSVFCHSFPDTWRKGDVIGFVDLCEIKLSVDTKEDLDRLREQHGRLFNSIKKSPKTFRL